MEGEDRISQLPDELLVKILSDFELRQAAQTSLLSSRWKTLWMFTTGDLYFVDPVALYNASRETLEEVRKKYTRWVNKVTKSHKGGKIHCLKICFDLDDSFKSDLDSWIEFAIQKKSRALDIVLKRKFKIDSADRYAFPEHVFSSFSSNMNFIKVIRLGWVDVSRIALEDILLNCRLLEAISVSHSETLTGGLSVSGLDFLELIEIRNCDKLEYIEISGAKLEGVVYAGPSTTSIRILHAPKLDAIHLGGDYCVNYSPLFPEISHIFSQLDMLILDYTKFDVWDILLSNFPKFKTVSKLELKLAAYDHESLLPFISVIQACPNVRSLVVTFAWIWDGCQTGRMMYKQHLGVNEKLKCLKKVDFRHFVGFTTDVELVSCVLENAPNVDDLLFWNPRSEEVFLLVEGGGESIDAFYEGKKAARDRARQLANAHSPNARLYVTC